MRVGNTVSFCSWPKFLCMYIERDNARERGRIHARLPTMDTAVAPTATNASREAYTTPRFFETSGSFSEHVHGQWGRCMVCFPFSRVGECA